MNGVDRYLQGQVVRFRNVFDDTVAGLVDPAGVKFRYSIEDGTPVELVYGTDVELVRESLGTYRVDLTLATAGRLNWRWLSTGNGQAAAQGVIEVDPAVP